MAQPLHPCTSIFFGVLHSHFDCLSHQWNRGISLFIFHQAMEGERSVGTIVAKLEAHKGRQRGYIAMLAVDPQWRGRKIGARTAP
jgi:ribosomal protein S18 acetylase RimI-like enzyme